MKESRGPNASVYSYTNTWKDVTFDDMKAFVAILLLIGLTKRSSFELYWTNDDIIEMPGFRYIMPRDRFLSILSFFHLSDNSKAKPRNHPEHDRAQKIRPLFEKLVPLWQKYFYPAKELSVIESIIPTKGRIGQLVYMPAKPNKWGLKAWGLTDAKTGYIYNWHLYLGGETDQTSRAVNVPYKVISSLSEDVQNKGHVIYMDNFFSSPALFHYLAQHGTGACGTLRVNRQSVPHEIKTANPRAGEPPVTLRDGYILYISWYDERPVNLLTTVHSAETFRKIVKPKRHENHTMIVYIPWAMQSFSQHMGGTGRTDKQMSYMVQHRCTKWWKRVFFYLLEVCFCNALVIWKAKSARRVNTAKFRLRIVHSLLEGYQSDVSHRRGRRVEDPPARLVLTEHHLIINPKRLKSGRPSRPDCAVCSNRDKKRHQTQFVCRKCDVALCPYPCFQRYHSLVDYKIDCSQELHKE